MFVKKIFKSEFEYFKNQSLNLGKDITGKKMIYPTHILHILGTQNVENHTQIIHISYTYRVLIYISYIYQVPDRYTIYISTRYVYDMCIICVWFSTFWVPDICKICVGYV